MNEITLLYEHLNNILPCASAKKKKKKIPRENQCSVIKIDPTLVF